MVQTSKVQTSRCKPRRCIPLWCKPRRCKPRRCIPRRCIPLWCKPRRCIPRRCKPLWCIPRRCENLYGANLEGAYLNGANLEGANLEGAYLYGANLEGAYGATLPMFCKWGVSHSSDFKTIKIGCKSKTIKEWDSFFASEEVYSTHRNTDEFKRIEACYKAMKEYVKFINK
jgi:hypothetical protein